MLMMDKTWTTQPFVCLRGMNTWSVDASKCYPPASEYSAILTGVDDNDLTTKVTAVQLYLFAAEYPFAPLPQTVEKLVIYHPPSNCSAFAFPSGLSHLQSLSLHDFHFLNSTTLNFPSGIKLKSLELTNCSTFRLKDVNIERLHLQDCEKVFLTTLPKVALVVQRVKFCIFAGSSIPTTLEELQLEDTSVNKLALPHSLTVFKTNHLRCEEVQFGKKSYSPVLNKQQINLEKIDFNWVKSADNPCLWAFLSEQACM